MVTRAVLFSPVCDYGLLSAVNAQRGVAYLPARSDIMPRILRYSLLFAVAAR
jgi:hypothetical protein